MTIAIQPKLKGKLIRPDEVRSLKFNCLLYGETDAWKTTIASHFTKPENTLVILTRRLEQAIPLAGKPFTLYYTSDSDDVAQILANPQLVWPSYGNVASPLVVLDDLSALKDTVIDEASVVERGGVLQPIADTREAYRRGTKTMIDIVRTALNQRYHFIAIALANVSSNPVTHEEQIAPDLPPAMLRSILSDFEHVFFLDRRTRQLYTTYRQETFSEVIDGRPVRHLRTIVAKYKAPLGHKPLQPAYKAEPEVLKNIWQEIQA